MRTGKSRAGGRGNQPLRRVGKGRCRAREGQQEQAKQHGRSRDAAVQTVKSRDLNRQRWELKHGGRERQERRGRRAPPAPCRAGLGVRVPNGCI